MMYSNMLSTNGLLSSKFGRQENSRLEVCDRDFSQLKGSQYDLSQYSQDYYSQTQGSGGSQCESQSQKVSAYDKYMSKPSLFRSSSSGKIIPSKIANSDSTLQSDLAEQGRSSSQASFQQNVSKAKERDERDILNSIVSIVQDCSDEVKVNISSIKEDSTLSEQMLARFLKCIEDTLENSTAKIVEILQEKDSNWQKECNLRKEITEKDARIQELQRKVIESQTSDDPSKWRNSLKSFLMEQQSKTEQRLQNMHDLASEELKLIKNQSACCRSMSDENARQFKDMKCVSQRQVQDVEKRVLDELMLLRDDFGRQKRETECFYKTQLKSIEMKQKRDLDGHFQHGIESGIRVSLEKAQEFYQQQCLSLKDFCSTLQENLESNIELHSSEQIKECIQKQESLYNRYQTTIQQGFQRTLNTVKASLDRVHSLQLDSERALDTYQLPSKVQTQLDNLHISHQAEIKQLEKELEQERLKRCAIESERRSRIETVSRKGLQGSTSLLNVYQLDNQRASSQSTKTSGQLNLQRTGFVSPRPPQVSGWNSKRLFGRANPSPSPSPIATVCPQPQMQKIASSYMNRKVGRQSYSLHHGQTSPLHEERISYLTRSKDRINQNENGKAENVIVNNPQTKSNKTSKGRKRKRTSKKRDVKHPKVETKGSLCEVDENQIHEKPPTNVGTFNQRSSSVNQVSSMNRTDMCVYDFRDQMSPTQGRLMNVSTPSESSSETGHRRSERKWLAFSPGSSSEGSQNSSPSVSMTDVYIRRRVITGSRTPDCKESSKDIFAFSDVTDFPNNEGRETDYFYQACNQLETFDHRLRDRPRHGSVTGKGAGILQIHQSVMQCTKKRGKKD